VPVPVAVPAGLKKIEYVPVCGSVIVKDHPQLMQPVELSCVPSGPINAPEPENDELAVIVTC
jgi:hypothetical protein